MQVEAHAFCYVVTCQSCGTTITIYYRDLRSCFSGLVPDEAQIKESLICVCEAVQPNAAPSSVVPLKR